MLRMLAALLAGGAMLTGALACGDDDDEEDTDGTATATGTSAVGGGDGDAQVSAFCEAVVEMEVTISAGPEREDQAAVDAYIEEADELLTNAADLAPNDTARGAVEGIHAVLFPGLEEQGEEVFGSDAFEAAESAFDEVVQPLCDYGEMNVTAIDYEFEGVDETVEPGPLSISLANEGEELHEFILIRVNDEETEIETLVDELLTLSEEELDEEAQFVGAVFAEQGDTGESLVRLEDPGRYVVLCFIPEGSTSFDVEGTGPPHAELGMYAEFTVE
jgi:uncharacterized cupredoxin-like copper-binding protein